MASARYLRTPFSVTGHSVYNLDVTRRPILKVLAACIALFAVLVVVLFVNAWRATSRQVQATPVGDPTFDVDAAAKRLAGGIRIRTVSYQDASRFSAVEFRRFHEYLETSFPKLHATLAKETVSEYSLLYTWKGIDETLPPVLLTAHMDVVPVEQSSEALWEQPPFDGQIQDGFIWGRGAWDDKGSLFGICEAVEMLVGEGFRPQRTIYLAFGHDEEVTGTHGASEIAKLLQSRGIRPEFVLDEGFAVTKGIFPGFTAPVAPIGISEKGYMTLELTATGAGGHSSMPEHPTAVGRLSAALAVLENNPVPGGIRGIQSRTFEYLAPESPMPNRLFLANLWLFRPLIERQMRSSAAGDASLRTTTAPTMLAASDKENVLPITATAVVNFRVHPEDTTDGVVEYVRRTIADDHVAIVVRTASPPSPISPVDDPAFSLVARSIREVFPNAVTAPGVVLGATDSRYYAPISERIYRFVPIVVEPQDVARFHGVNERISVEGYGRVIQFYRQIIANSSSGRNDTP